MPLSNRGFPVLATENRPGAGHVHIREARITKCAKTGRYLSSPATASPRKTENKNSRYSKDRHPVTKPVLQLRFSNRVLTKKVGVAPDVFDGPDGGVDQKHVGSVAGGKQTERLLGDRVRTIETECFGRNQRGGFHRVGRRES